MKSLQKNIRPEFTRSYFSVDCVVFGFDPKRGLNILLVQKNKNGSKVEQQRKLPGSLIYEGENLDEAAERVLCESTGIKKMVLKQFKCFADPLRASKQDDIRWMNQEYQPNLDRIITVAYLSLCKIDHKLNSTKYETVDWFPVDKVPVLPFDHNEIITESLTEIRKWMTFDFSIAFELLPRKFTIRQLFQLYNAISEKSIDIKNFHKKVAGISYIVPLEETEKGVSHRAARYYKFDSKSFKKNKNQLIK